MKNLKVSAIMVMFVFSVAGLAFVSDAGADPNMIPWANDSGSADSFDWQNGGSEVGLFGDPEVVGDTFTFSPDNFSVQVSNGQLGDLWDFMSVEINAHPDFVITGIQITEYGDYGILGSGTVDAFGFMDIEDTDTSNFYYTDLVTDPVMPIAGVFQTGDWLATGTISGLNCENIVLSLENGIFAMADPGSAVYIEKKLIGNSVAVTIIPEPATIALILLGSTALLRKTRKSN